MLDRHAAALTLFARQWCVAAEDVVQEAFIKLAGQRPTPQNPTAWLYQVVRNGAISAGRAERRRQQHESAACHNRPWLVETADSQLDAQTATAALQQLPQEQREVMVAHLWGGLTFEEIGRITGCSASTAHRRYLAGLLALRQRLRVPCSLSENPLS